MVTYTDPAAITATQRTDVPPSGQTVSGYGGQIPTQHMVRIGTRWHRVYVMCYGNSGSAYVRQGGRTLFLDTDTEHRLSTSGQASR